MTKTVLGRLRLIGVCEGISFLVLLGVAMPLKYLADQPMAVKVTGWIHGVLFIAYVLALLDAYRTHAWPLRRGAMVFFAALIPLGPFLVDGTLKREDQAHEQPA